MQAKLLKNIDVVHINVQAGVDEYYLPKNVDWNGKRIDRLALVTAPAADTMFSPIDGTTPVLTKEQVKNMYIDLYTADDKDLTHELSAEQLLYNNNHPFCPETVISLDLSRIYFTTTPEEDGCLLLYVFYDMVEVPDYEPSSRSVTVAFPLAAGEAMRFTDIISRYIHADYHNVRGIMVWDAEDNPAYIMLRDFKLEHVMQSVYTGFFRPQMMGADAEHIQVAPAYIDCMDIDFDYSTIRNATNANQMQKITFEY